MKMNKFNVKSDCKLFTMVRAWYSVLDGKINEINESISEGHFNQNISFLKNKQILENIQAQHDEFKCCGKCNN